MLYRMYAMTSLRDQFAIRSKEYYLQVWSELIQAEMAYPLVAEVDGEPVSALILFVFANRGYYFYGMSTKSYRERMPNHLLQWEAICLSKQLGCITYDFWGAPDEFDVSDSMYGVYRFKEGFSGKVLFGIGAMDFVISPWKYQIYTHLLPRFLSVMRKLGREKVKGEVLG